jgi:hypothetical protein
MQFDYKAFHIDCRARHVKHGHYFARARVTRVRTGDDDGETHDPGDVDSFVDEARRDPLHQGVGH